MTTGSSAARIAPPGLAPPEEPYVHAVKAGTTLYMAGQVAFDERGEVVGPATVVQVANLGLDSLLVEVDATAVLSSRA